jgi:hypothetical protein
MVQISRFEAQVIQLTFDVWLGGVYSQFVGDRELKLKLKLEFKDNDSEMSDVEGEIDTWTPFPMPGYLAMEVSNRGEYRYRNPDGSYYDMEITAVLPWESS